MKRQSLFAQAWDSLLLPLLVIAATYGVLLALASFAP